MISHFLVQAIGLSQDLEIDHSLLALMDQEISHSQQDQMDLVTDLSLLVQMVQVTSQHQMDLQINHSLLVLMVQVTGHSQQAQVIDLSQPDQTAQAIDHSLLAQTVQMMSHHQMIRNQLMIVLMLLTHHPDHCHNQAQCSQPILIKYLHSWLMIMIVKALTNSLLILIKCQTSY